eukprot:TRINITY_DN12927_c0_g1_i1.p1 TRINITY_DN12927_c0_g1~~TRINITY_DN12927_c0_g1_i1.p1  ORF type:complete len:169 (+),score=46.89 TRINITY_DN12927_c0_g1_i1:68-574(+)
MGACGSASHDVATPRCLQDMADSDEKEEKKLIFAEVQCLIKKGRDPNTGAVPALMSAVEESDLLMVRFLLEAGAAPRIERHGFPLLHTAVSNGCLVVVQELLRAGADPLEVNSIELCLKNMGDKCKLAMIDPATGQRTDWAAIRQELQRAAKRQQVAAKQQQIHKGGC